MRLTSLNLNHRTRARAVPSELIGALLALGPDVLVLTEYVEPTTRHDVRVALAEGGLRHVALSDLEPCSRPGCWENQILVASREPIRVIDRPPGAPGPSARTNILIVETLGLQITGLRAPAYVATSDWYQYWEWLSGVISGDLVIGDLNADPRRNGPRDRVLGRLAAAGAWIHTEPDGAWSYKGTKGNTSRLDHVLHRGPIESVRARYVAEPFCPAHTDHAALVVDL